MRANEPSVCSGASHTRTNTILAIFLTRVGRGHLTYTLVATKQTGKKLKVTEAADRVTWSFRDGLKASARRSDKGIRKLPSEPSSREWVGSVCATKETTDLEACYTL